AGFDGILDGGNRRGTQPVECRGIDAPVPRPQTAARAVRRRYPFGPRRMMDCAQYRRLVLANPHDPNPELRIHLDSCRDCPEYTERLLRFESRLARAVRVTAPAESGARVVPLRAPAALAPRWDPTPPVRRGWLAMAASVLIVLVA